MRWLMWFVIGFAAACALCAYAWGSWLIAVAVLAAAVAVAAILFARKDRRFRIPATLFAGLLVGFGWFLAFDGLYLHVPRILDGKTVPVTLTVTDYSYGSGFGSAVDVELEALGNTYRGKAYIQDLPNLAPGDRLKGQFRLRFTSDGGSQDPTYHRGDGVYLLFYQTGTPEVMKGENVSNRFFAAHWRRWLLERIDLLFPEEAAGFAKALVLGERSDIDYETNTAFKVSGISHIIAVSGLHVSILFALLSALCLHNRYLTGIVCIPVLFLFAAVVGFSPSITRACIMMSMMLLANMLNRDYDPPTALAFSALVMLMCNPMTVVSVSFQLSFASVSGIYLFSERFRQWLLSPGRLGSGKGKGILPRMKRWFAASVSITLGANLMTVPLVACYFGTVSLVGILTNLLVLWLVSLVFYGILLACLVSLVFMKAGFFVGLLVSLPIRFILWIAKTLAKLPFAAVYTESEYIVFWLIFCYALLTVFLLIRKRPVFALICCTVLGLCFCQLFAWAEPLMDTCRVTALDVGQGQAILLQSRGKTFLVDCGSSDGEDAADKTAEYLMSQGIYTLDGILVTHYDSDHVGGIPYLLTRIRADALYLPVDLTQENTLAKQLAELAGERMVSVASDLDIRFAGTEIHILSPENGSFDNESSICVLFQTEKCDILITGDRGKSGEAALLRHTALPKLELLIAGHHGSGNSTGSALLSATMPETVFISVGEDNRYGHPSAEVLQRLDELGIQVFRTDRNGDLIFRG